MAAKIIDKLPDFFSLDTHSEKISYKILLSGRITLLRDKSDNETNSGSESWSVDSKGCEVQYLLSLTGALSLNQQLLSNEISAIELKKEPESFSDSYSESKCNFSSQEASLQATPSKTKNVSKVDKQSNTTIDTDDEDNDSDYFPGKEEDDDDDEEFFSKNEVEEENVEEMKITFKMKTNKSDKSRKLLSVRKKSKVPNSLVKLKFKKSIFSVMENEDKRLKKQCEKCGFSCLQDRALIRHMETHIIGNAVRMKKVSPSKTDTIGRFLCPICDYPTKTAASMMKHISRNHKHQKFFGCTICDYSAENKSDLDEHVASEHMANSTFCCKTCDLKLETEEELVYHVSKLHTSKQVSCFLCFQKFNTTTALKVHTLEKHTTILNPPFQCGVCEFKTSHFRRFDDHGLRKHCDEKQFLCSICGSAFKTKISLRQHVQLHGANRFFCTECPYSCKTAASLNFHKRVRHTNIRPFLCEFCPYRAKTQCGLRQHKSQVHSDIRPFACTICPFAAKTNTNLKTHYHNVHSTSKPFICNLCSYAAKSKSLLERHKIRQHSTEKPLLCEQCDYRCKLESSLKIHYERKHNLNRAKNHKCPHCDYCTDCKQSLKEHILRRHTEDRPWACSICSYSAKTSRALYAHMRKKHKIRSSKLMNLQSTGSRPLDFTNNQQHKAQDYTNLPTSQPMEYVHEMTSRSIDLNALPDANKIGLSNVISRGNIPISGYENVPAFPIPPHKLYFPVSHLSG